MAVANGWGTHCRLYNPSRGTFHPKVVVSRGPFGRHALVGSANITAGLLANVEAGVLLSGEQAEDVAQLVESWWDDPQAVDWHRPVSPVVDRFDDPLWSLIEQYVQPGDVLHTLSGRKPNRVVERTRAGLWVETERSRHAGGGPQLVEPWMVDVAWAALTTDGSLTNRHLLEELRVHRSSFVCALLAALQNVEVTNRRSITLSVAASTSPAPMSHSELAAESGPPYNQPDDYSATHMHGRPMDME